MTDHSAVELDLDSFDPLIRQQALDALLLAHRRGEIEFAKQGNDINLHCHTFFSFNGYGYSPTRLAWLGRSKGLYAMGVVDFDVLDAVEEFLSAAGRLGLKHCGGIETRVFIPEFANDEINSPAEPGVAYHMGVGFVSSTNVDTEFLGGLKATAQQRGRDIIQRVNAFLDPVAILLEDDVAPLTPNGNATERHLCAAYAAKAESIFPDSAARASYWQSKLGGDVDKLQAIMADPPTFQGQIRSKTMKLGGAGYIRPDGPRFPRMDRFNEFVKQAGAIPTCAWLDGVSSGEQRIEELLDLEMSSGVAALNIIPDRNWNIKNPEEKRRKIMELDKIISICKRRGLFILVGTEMNAYGQRFVDNFRAPELEQHMDEFLTGAHVAYAHTALQRAAGLGYLSEWAISHFPSLHDRIQYYAEFGKRLSPELESRLDGVHLERTPSEILNAIQS